MMKEGTGFPANEGAERIRQLAWGYIPAALIGVIIELGVPDLVANGAKTTSEIAAAAHANEDALYRMLRTLASFGVFTETSGRRFALTSAGNCLRSDVPGSLRGYVRWVTNGLIFRSYAEVMHSAKTGENAMEYVLGESLFSHLQTNPELSQTFNDGMTSFSQLVSKAVLEAYDFSGIKVLADIGGGEGALLSSIVQKYPAMRGLLLEQAHVLAGAHKRFAQSGLAERYSAAPVDFFKGVPAGADAYLMKSILHDWDDERASVILKNCREALRNVEGGKLILVEGIVPPGNDPHMVKISDMQMLVLAGGRERTREEFQALLEESGFLLTAVVPTQTFVSVIEATPQ
ncbi:MAG TPA: methyltransferase [Candidatus Dormibacteraeota bacterium]|nr:methyltransferase [Candidatus Dormibacteraeota bacterium]